METYTYKEGNKKKYYKSQKELKSYSSQTNNRSYKSNYNQSNLNQTINNYNKYKLETKIISSSRERASDNNDSKEPSEKDKNQDKQLEILRNENESMKKEKINLIVKCTDLERRLKSKEKEILSHDKSIKNLSEEIKNQGKVLEFLRNQKKILIQKKMNYKNN